MDDREQRNMYQRNYARYTKAIGMQMAARVHASELLLALDASDDKTYEGRLNLTTEYLLENVGKWESPENIGRYLRHIKTKGEE